MRDDLGATADHHRANLGALRGNSKGTSLDCWPAANALQQSRALLLNILERPRPRRIMPRARENDILQYPMRSARAGSRVRVMSAQGRRKLERDLTKGCLGWAAIGDQRRTLLPPG